MEEPVPKTESSPSYVSTSKVAPMQSEEFKSEEKKPPLDQELRSE